METDSDHSQKKHVDSWRKTGDFDVSADERKKLLQLWRNDGWLGVVQRPQVGKEKRVANLVSKKGALCTPA